MAEGITRAEAEPVAIVETFKNEDAAFRLTVRRVDDEVILEEEARELDLEEVCEEDWWGGDAAIAFAAADIDVVIAGLLAAKHADSRPVSEATKAAEAAGEEVVHDPVATISLQRDADSLYRIRLFRDGDRISIEHESQDADGGDPDEDGWFGDGMCDLDVANVDALIAGLEKAKERRRG